MSDETATDPVERPPPQDAPAGPWRWPARTKAAEPITFSEADPILRAVRAGQGTPPEPGQPSVPADPQYNDPFWRQMGPVMRQAGVPAGNLIPEVDPETGQPRPLGPPATPYERAAMTAQWFGNALPNRGELRAPLEKTAVKYVHPVTGEEPTKVFHGTPAVFQDFAVDAKGKGGLFGPGIYFTENPAMTTGYAMHGMDPLVQQKIMEVDSAERMYQVALEKRDAKLAELKEKYSPHVRATAERTWHEWVAEEAARVAKAKKDLVVVMDATAHRTTAAPNVRPAYLDIKKPFDADTDMVDPKALLAVAKKTRDAWGATGNPTAETLIKKLEARLRYPEPHEATQNVPTPGRGVLYEELDDWIGKDETTRLLQRLGYDGITHMGGAVSGGDRHRVWIVFKPEQVLSPFEYEARRPSPLTPPQVVPQGARK